MATANALDEFKDWQRLDGDDHDAAAGIALAAAEVYIANATGLDLAVEKAAASDDWIMVRVACLSLAGHFFENREATSPLQINTIPLGIRNIIAQLTPEV